MRFLVSILSIVISLSFFTTKADADVLIESGNSSIFAAAGIPGVMMLDVDSGSGQAGNYLLLTCGAFGISNNNSFNAPAPGIFTELDTENCGNQNLCISGIWGGFTNNPASEMLTCNTTGTSVLFTAVSLRYSNVDDMNPIIGIDCTEGTGNTATAPSIMTEAGSQVVRIFNSFAFIEEVFNELMVTPQMADITAETTVDGGQVSSIFRSDLINSQGPTGTADQVYIGSQRDWRACTIALRMVPDPPTMPPPTITLPPPTLVPTHSVNVPTLSEWGHLSVVILLLVAGAWFLRRRRAKV